VLAWCERLPAGRGFHLRLSRLTEPLPLQGDDAQALQAAQAAVINRAMQQLILQCPQQYLWATTATRGRAARTRLRRHEVWPAHVLLGLLWLLHWLPLWLQAALGGALGRVLYTVARERRRISARNVQLCLPELSAQQRRTLLREHFRWLGRSAVERALLWYAPPERLRRLIHVEGDVTLAERSERP